MVKDSQTLKGEKGKYTYNVEDGVTIPRGPQCFNSKRSLLAKISLVRPRARVGERLGDTIVGAFSKNLTV